MDPISAQLTQSALKGVSQPSAPINKTPNFQTEQSSFGHMLDNQISSGNTATDKLLSLVDNMAGDAGGSSMKAIPADGIQVDLSKVEETGSSASSNKSAIFDLFKEVNGSQNNMDALLEQLSSGKKFSTQEMVRLQVFAHQHTVTYELVSKFGEMAGRAVQTPFQMQV